MNRRARFFLFLLALHSAPLQAQTPFDMTPERPSSETTPALPAPSGSGQGEGTASQPVVETPSVDTAEPQLVRRFLLPKGNVAVSYTHLTLPTTPYV